MSAHDLEDDRRKCPVPTLEFLALFTMPFVARSLGFCEVVSERDRPAPAKHVSAAVERRTEYSGRTGIAGGARVELPAMSLGYE